jgi:hypothetical protein
MTGNRSRCTCGRQNTHAIAVLCKGIIYTFSYSLYEKCHCISFDFGSEQPTGPDTSNYMTSWDGGLELFGRKLVRIRNWLFLFQVVIQVAQIPALLPSCRVFLSVIPFVNVFSFECFVNSLLVPILWNSVLSTVFLDDNFNTF